MSDETIILPVPLFLVFEGIDGSGKSTQSELLRDHFENAGVGCRHLSEPTGGQWGRQIRELLLQEDMQSADQMLDLFIRDRQEDVSRNILPALNGGTSVIMDRYYYSNAAYQGAMGIPADDILRKNREQGFPEPDRVYFIDLEPDVALQRVAERSEDGKKDVFEKAGFLEKVRENYLSIVNDRFVVIDGTGSRDEIFSMIISDIEEKFR